MNTNLNGFDYTQQKENDSILNYRTENQIKRKYILVLLRMWSSCENVAIFSNLNTYNLILLWDENIAFQNLS